LPINRDVSIHLLITEMFIDSEVDQPCCIDAPLRLVSKHLDAKQDLFLITEFTKNGAQIITHMQ